MIFTTSPPADLGEQPRGTSLRITVPARSCTSRCGTCSSLGRLLVGASPGKTSGARSQLWGRADGSVGSQWPREGPGAPAGPEPLTPPTWQGQDELLALGRQRKARELSSAWWTEQAVCNLTAEAAPVCMQVVQPEVRRAVARCGHAVCAHADARGCTWTVLAVVCACTEHVPCELETRRCSPLRLLYHWRLLGGKAPFPPTPLPSSNSFMLSPLLILRAPLGDGLGGL